MYSIFPSHILFEINLFWAIQAQCCASYRNKSFDWQCKSNDWFIYEIQCLGWNGLILEVQCSMETSQRIANQLTSFYMLVPITFSGLTCGLKLQVSVFWFFLLLLISLFNFGRRYELMCICDALRDMVLFVQFKKRQKHTWRSVTFSN